MGGVLPRVPGTDGSSRGKLQLLEKQGGNWGQQLFLGDERPLVATLWPRVKKNSSPASSYLAFRCLSVSLSSFSKLGSQQRVPVVILEVHQSLTPLGLGS